MIIGTTGSVLGFEQDLAVFSGQQGPEGMAAMLPSAGRQDDGAAEQR